MNRLISVLNFNLPFESQSPDGFNLFESIIGFFSNIKATLTDVYSALRNFDSYMDHMIDYMTAMIEQRTVEGINLVPYIGTIRYVVGDIIFYQMYFVILILIIIELAFIFTKMVDLVGVLISKIAGSSALELFKDSKLFRKIVELFM